MAVKTLYISSDGVPLEVDKTADVIEALGYEVNDPSTDGIQTTSEGIVAFDDIMAEDLENTMALGASILFPTVTDVADNVDAFRLPTLAGAPTASPSDGGEGYPIWDSTNDKLYMWDGSSWKDLSISNEANSVCNQYTADEILAARDVLYISAADNVSKADCSAGGAPSRVVGLAQAAAADTANVVVCSEGLMSGFTGLTAGARYYQDPGIPGGITTTTPVGSGNTIVQVGYAKSTTELHIHIEQLGRRT